MQEYITFKQLSLEWVDSHTLYVKESTLSNYKYQLHTHIIPYFEDTSLDCITNDHLQVFVNDKYHFGKVDGSGGLATKTIKDLMVILSQILEYSFIKGNTPRFHIKIKYPKDRNLKHLETFNNQEMNKLVSYLQTSISLKTIGLLIVIHTGIRIGEVCSLTWKDVNLKEKHISINKTIQRLYIVEEDNR